MHLRIFREFFQFPIVQHIGIVYRRQKTCGSRFVWMIEDVFGFPCSTMLPPSKNTTWSEALRAKRISWVTISMVVLESAKDLMTASTPSTISGSRAEVGSSNTSSSGSMAIARAMATRCCCPPDSLLGYRSANPAIPTRSSSSYAIRLASFLPFSLA